MITPMDGASCIAPKSVGAIFYVQHHAGGGLGSDAAAVPRPAQFGQRRWPAPVQIGQTTTWLANEAYWVDVSFQRMAFAPACCQM